MPVPLEAQLSVVIVGAGLGGLAAAISIAQAGHKVHVLEQAKVLTEVGAGLQITPNGSRLVQHWKVPGWFWKTVAEPTSLTVHRYPGEVLSHEATFDKDMRRRYCAPFVDSHRADLQQALYERAVELGVQFTFDAKVQALDLKTPSATFSDQTVRCDLIVAADGLWSTCREAFLGYKDPLKPTGDLAYRIVLTTDQVHDEDLKKWIKTPTVHFWIGPGSHVVSYSLKAGTMCNIVLLVPDDLPPNVSREGASTEQMRALFKGWDPVLTRFLSFVPKVEKWKLMHLEEMQSWINDEGTVAFLGDACHSMLPYLAQGANSSLEDGAVLGTLLGRMKTKADLKACLSAYERLRKSRGENIARETFKQRHAFHMNDGPEQEERDRIMRLGPGGSSESPHFPSRWQCPIVQPWLYGYDAISDAQIAEI